jgi:hypothetical protein
LDNLVNERLIAAARGPAETLQIRNDVKNFQLVSIFTDAKNICAVPAKNGAA